MARTIVDELVTILDFKTSAGSETQINKFKNSMNGLKKVAIIAGSALSAAGAAFSVRKVNESAFATIRLADSINLGTDKLQAFRHAGQQVGISLNAMDSALKHITTTASSPIPGEFNRTLLQMGINVTDSNKDLKSGAQLLIEISAALKGVSKIQQVQFAEKLGLGELSVFLQQTPEQISKLLIESKKIGAIVPRAALERSIAFQQNMRKIGTTFKSLSQVIILSITPALTRLIAKFEKFLLANHELITSAILNVLEGIKVAFRVLSIILTPILLVFNKFLDILKNSATATKTLGVIMGALISLKLVKMISKVGLLTLEFIGLNKIVKLTTVSFKALAIARGLAIPIVGTAVAAGFGLSMLAKNETVKKFVEKPGVQHALDVSMQAPGSAFGLPRQFMLSEKRLQRMANNNVTVNVNGAKEPRRVAEEVINQIDLNTAAQITSPSNQRPITS